MSDRNAKMSNHFLRFSTDEFRGTGNDIFRLCMRNSGYKNRKSSLLGYIHTWLSIGAFSPIGVARGGQAIGAFCHQVTRLFRWDRMWVKGCTFSSVTALAALLSAWQGGCATGTALVTWLISLCLLALSTDFPSTRQFAVEWWLCQSYKYLVYNETNVIEAFQVLNFALPDLIFAFCLRSRGPCWVRTKPSALHDISLEVMSVPFSQFIPHIVNERNPKSVARFSVHGEHLLKEGNSSQVRGAVRQEWDWFRVTGVALQNKNEEKILKREEDRFCQRELLPQLV